MSAIVSIKEVKVNNLPLALEVAKGMNYKEMASKSIRGSGSGKVDYAFDINGYKNFGFRLNKEGTYDIVCDDDTLKTVQSGFVVNYVKEFALNAIKLQGKTHVINETADFITIEYDA